jgi:hypothetical protein
VTFEEHLEKFRRDDGSFDLAAAEKSRAEELAEDPDALQGLAAKAAAQERAAWERKNSTILRKQLMQPALSPELEWETMVQIGDSTAVRYGDMNNVRIRLRKDLRTKVHLDENRAYDIEMTHWMTTEILLDDGETIAAASMRMHRDD